MKNNILLLIFCTFLVSCATKIDENTSKGITISGRIINYDYTSEKSTIRIIINDNGLADQINFHSEIDSTGYFNIKFECYYPQDVMIAYKTNFRVMVHPGDSLFIEFDGSTNQRTKIFKTISFSGDHAEINQQLAIYLKHFFETRPSSYQRREFKKLQLDEYKAVQDSIRKSRQAYANNFYTDHQSSNELIRWINTNIEFSYYDNLIAFPDRQKYANYPDNWHIDYFNFIDSIPRINTETLIYADTRWFINQYLQGYIFANIFDFGGKIKTTNFDSLFFYKIIELVPDDGLIEQLALTEYINLNLLSKYKLAFYEENQNIINEKITKSFLREPTAIHYKEIKSFLEKPVKAEDLVKYHLEDQKAIEIWNTILNEGKEKVLYIDCWGTWCGACLNEIPAAINMYEKYQGKDVKFIYLCFESPKDQWEKVINQFQLKGNHYFLNTDQGEFFVKLFGITGYPTYVIINKEGFIVRKGSSFRPSNNETESIITELL